MSTKIIHYSVCRYVPDILRDEFINVGVLTHVPEEEWCHFYRTKNLTRIKNFDDEVELDVISVLLESLEYQFNSNIFSSPEHEGIGNHDFLSKEISNFVNQIQFSEIRTLTSEDLQEDIQDLCDMYLYYDKKKSERINKDRVRRLVSKMFSTSRLRSFVDRTPDLFNNFKQRPFDFSIKVNNHETYIKALSFDYKQSNKFYNEIKAFLYDLEYFRNMNINDIKVVINNTEFEKDFEKLALKILKEKTDVYTLSEFSEYINEAETEFIK
jgi:hypothetical protein